MNDQIARETSALRAEHAAVLPFPLNDANEAPLSPNGRLSYRILKRAMDIAVSVVTLTILSPLLLVIAVLVKLEEPRESVLFRQRRVGLNGREFILYKFRSMRPGAEKQRDELLDQNEMDGPVFKIRDDPRVTRFGKFIRKTSIDEFPQFINVLLGQMSIVGPRPLPVIEAEACVGPHQQRHLVKPGITCVWQISGRNEISYEQWMEMDLEYIRRQTIVFDIKLLFLTVPRVLLRKGAY